MSFIEIGVITGAYGIRGWVKIKPFATGHLSGNVLFTVRKWRLVESHSYEHSSKACWVTVLNIKQHHNFLIAQFAECNVRELAQTFKGWQVSVCRADFPELPPNEYYWADLIGLKVVNMEGIALGTVHHLIDHGAHAVLCIKSIASAMTRPEKNHELLIPFVNAYILEIDLTKHQLVVNWPQDWINEDANT